MTNECKYRKAVSLKENGDYEEAFKLFRELGDYGDSREQFAKFKVIYEKKVENDNFGQKRVYKYTYDENGNLLKEVKPDLKPYLDENGNAREEVYPDSRIIEYAYDENGVLSKKTERFRDRVIQCCYNTHGDVTKDIRTYSDGTVEFVECKYTYDENGNVLKLEETDSDGNFFIAEYVYDKYGNLLKHNETYSNDKPFSKEYTYTYDENGNILKCCVEPLRDDGFDMLHTTEYTYYEDGKLHKKRGTTLKGYIHLYEYDKNEKLLKSVAMNANGVIDLKQEYTYDANGKTLRVNVTDASGSDITEYAYDEFGNVLSITTQDNCGVKEKETYEYSGMRVFLKKNDKDNEK